MASLNFHPIILAGILAAITYGVVLLLMRRPATKLTSLQTVIPAVGAEQSLRLSSYDPLSRISDPDEPEFEIEGIEDNTLLELVEDDTSILLKEAEVLTEEVSRVIDGIASQPPNPTEVFTKLRNLLSQYGIFQNTEFYDAINRFVAVAVERDLGIQFTHGQLTELWS